MDTKGRAPHLRPKSLYPHFHFHLAGLCPEKLVNKGRREEGEPLDGNKNNTMWFQKLSIPPPKKGFFLRPPTSLEIPVKLHTLTKSLWPFENLPSIECSHDVTAAILVSQNNETAAMLVSQTNPLGVELFSYANAFFCSNKFA